MGQGYRTGRECCGESASARVPRGHSRAKVWRGARIRTEKSGAERAVPGRAADPGGPRRAGNAVPTASKAGLRRPFSPLFPPHKHPENGERPQLPTPVSPTPRQRAPLHTAPARPLCRAHPRPSTPAGTQNGGRPGTARSGAHAWAAGRRALAPYRRPTPRNTPEPPTRPPTQVTGRRPGRQTRPPPRSTTP